MVFDYHNLFASCGKNLEKNISKTCGHAKTNWHDPANQDLFPSHPDCERRFRYGGTGQISAKRESDALASQAITAMNLNESALKNERKDLIEKLENLIKRGEIDALTKDDTIADYRAIDGEGRAKPLGHVAALYLEQEKI